MRRRDFIAGLGAAAWPLPARAQQRAVPVIGVLGTTSRDKSVPSLAGFRQGLKAAGFNEGENVAIEYRWAESNYDRLPALAAELAHLPVNVIVAIDGLPSTLAARASTTTVPIVFLTAADPIQYGLVNSLNRPGGNLTGVTVLGGEIGPKRLELLHELIPTTQVMALLINPTNPGLTETISRDAQAAARVLGLQLHVLRASTAGEIDEAFATLRKVRAGGLVLSADTFFTSRLDQFVALGRRDAVPTIYHTREFVAAGGLMSYATDFSEAWRQAGIACGRILSGEKPSELPIQQAVKVELVINLKTAKALGLTVPATLLVSANEVIE